MSKLEYLEAMIELRDKIESSHKIDNDERIRLMNWIYDIESTMLGFIYASIKNVIDEDINKTETTSINRTV